MEPKSGSRWKVLENLGGEFGDFSFLQGVVDI
jgi:hypothetical protein